MLYFVSWEQGTRRDDSARWVGLRGNGDDFQRLPLQQLHPHSRARLRRPRRRWAWRHRPHTLHQLPEHPRRGPQQQIPQTVLKKTQQKEHECPENPTNGHKKFFNDNSWALMVIQLIYAYYLMIIHGHWWPFMLIYICFWWFPAFPLSLMPFFTKFAPFNQHVN